MRNKGPKEFSLEKKMGIGIEEILKEALDKYKSAYKVAEILDVPYPTVMYWVNKYQISYTLSRYSGESDLVQSMHQMRRNKVSFEDIGKKFGYTADQVYARLKKRALERSS
jgi:hypothetical protein